MSVCASHSATGPTWDNDRSMGGLLRCVDCGIAWPGHELPVPLHTREGYGAVGEQPGWNRRVRAMVSELDETDV